MTRHTCGYPKCRNKIEFNTGLKFCAKCQKVIIESEVCRLADEVEEFTRSVWLNNLCFDIGKYLFEPDEESKKLNEIIGFSPRMDMKNQQKIYFEFDELNFKNSYLLLSCYIESTFNLAKDLQDELVNRSVIFKKAELDKVHESLFDKKKNIFSTERIKTPRFLRTAQFVWNMANIIKHKNMVVHSERSGKILIDEYGVPERTEICHLMSFEVEGGKYCVKSNSIARVAFITCFFLKDFLSNFFNVPSVKESSLKKLYKKIAREALRKNVMAVLEMALREDGLF